jgi:hypothetical protein
VRFDRPWGYEEPCGDVLVAKAFGDQPYHVQFGRSERCPARRGAFPFAASA